MKIVYQESTEDYLVEVIIKEKKIYVLFLDRMSESVRKYYLLKTFIYQIFMIPFTYLLYQT